MANNTQKYKKNLQRGSRRGSGRGEDSLGRIFAPSEGGDAPVTLAPAGRSRMFNYIYDWGRRRRMKCSRNKV